MAAEWNLVIGLICIFCILIIFPQRMSGELCPGLNEQLNIMSRINIDYTDKFDTGHYYQFMYGFLFRCSHYKLTQFFKLGLGCYPGFKAQESRAWKLILPNATQNYSDYMALCPIEYTYVKAVINGKLYIGDQADEILLQKVCDEHPMGMDVIIDDGSHCPRHQVVSIKYLFSRLLRPNGYYVIEDLFFNFVDHFTGDSPVSAMVLISRTLIGIVRGTALPAGLDDCTEVVCQLGICWFKKSASATAAAAATTTTSTTTSTTINITTHDASRHAVSQAFCYPEVKTLLERQLACEELRGRHIYRVMECAKAEEGQAQPTAVKSDEFPSLFRDSYVKPYMVGADCDNTLHPAVGFRHSNISLTSPFAVIDDSRASVTYRIRAFKELFIPVLAPGGYYFWKNDPNNPYTNIFITSLYSMYCDIKSFPKENRRNPKPPEKLAKWRVGSTYVDTELCQPNSAIRDVFHVGCDATWCYVQKRPTQLGRVAFHVLYAGKSTWRIKTLESDRMMIFNALRSIEEY